jgi:quinol monooxygenase YgiN
MITCTATLRVSPGKEAEFEKLLLELVANVHEHEPGCTLFHFVRSQSDPRTYLVIELYSDREAYDRHHGTDYLERTIPVMMTYLASDPELEEYDPVG